MRLGGRRREYRKAGQLRQGQFLTTFGCGAIVDLPGESVIMAGTDFWRHHETDEFRLYEETLQRERKTFPTW
ncbi:MAG: hypothetical protein KGZ75_05930 [Syntrophomonadaceae bacterium]|nr:hypothetical protein [Syntrophomonadaceae bacterium]